MSDARMHLLEVRPGHEPPEARQQRHRTLAATQAAIGGVRYYRISGGSLGFRAASLVCRESIRIATAFRVRWYAGVFRTSNRSVARLIVAAAARGQGTSP